MQKLWGRILSDEVKQPNTYSIRALNTLRFLRKADAEKFSKICCLLLSDMQNSCYMMLYDNKYMNEKFNIIPSDMVHLEELGLIYRPTLTKYSKEILVDENNAIFTYGRKKVFWYKGEDVLAILVLGANYYYLTNLGKELLQLATLIYHADYVDIIKNQIERVSYNEEQECSLFIADFDTVNLKSFPSFIDISLFTNLEIAWKYNAILNKN
jgi:uncharacterized protein DUF2806